MIPSRILHSQYPSAHADYTTLYDRVQEVAAGTVTASYANIVAVIGNNVTVNAPVMPANPPPHKDTRHFAVVNVTGATGLTVGGAGATINGAVSLAIPAFAGAFAEIWWSVDLGAWVAFVNGTGALAWPPTYTARGPIANQVFTSGSTDAVANASIITAPFTTQQKAIITYTAEVHNVNAGNAAQAVMSLFDGISTNPIDGPMHEDLNLSALEVIDHHIVTMTTEVIGNGGARTFGLAITAADANNVGVFAQLCRGVVQVVNG